ncbi:MAG TPA: hypothetical protein VNI01_07740 [Elusimicrobiota bacterium]|jgi:hypothetical protein|nr:hypothetical protein [Elusimicrobiota bacterium]
MRAALALAAVLIAPAARAQDLRLPTLPALQRMGETPPPPPAPAPRAVWTDGSERLVETEWLAALKDLDPAVSSFLAESKTRIVFTAPRPGMFDQNESQLAQYEAGTIYVNLRQLRAFAQPIFDKAPAEDAVRHLALLTVPIVSHEARHGISRRELTKLLGQDYPYGSQEDETIAFAHQALVVYRLDKAHGRTLAAYANHPMALDNHTLLVRLRLGGVVGGEGIFAGIDGIVRNAPGYRNHPVMAQMRPQTFIDGTLAGIERNNLLRRRSIARALGALSEKPDSEETRARRAALEAESETVERELDKVAGARAVLSDEALFRSLRGYYADTIQGLQSAWEKEKGGD